MKTDIHKKHFHTQSHFEIDVEVNSVDFDNLVVLCWASWASTGNKLKEIFVHRCQVSPPSCSFSNYFSRQTTIAKDLGLLHANSSCTLYLFVPYSRRFTP